MDLCWLLPWMHDPMLRLHPYAYELPLKIWRW
jgi:hypothetical protein